MATTKAKVSEWNAFAMNPTTIEHQSSKIDPVYRGHISTIFKEIFVEKVMGEEGEMISRTRCTNYRSFSGDEMTKEDYDQAWVEQNTQCPAWKNRRELAHKEEEATSRIMTGSSYQAMKAERNNATGQLRSEDWFNARQETSAYQTQAAERTSSAGRQTLDDSFTVSWQLAPSDKLHPVSCGNNQRSAKLPPHLRSGPVIPSHRELTSHQSRRSDSSVPPHLREGPAFT